MSDNQLTITKVAYISGMADTLGDVGLVRWPSASGYELGVLKTAQALAFDPADVEEVDVKTAGEICDHLIKLAAEMCEESESDDDESSEDDMNKVRAEALRSDAEASEDEKTAAVNYWALCDAAKLGARKLAAALNGMNPGQNVTGNSLNDAQAHDSIAQIENRRRPSGYAENAPDDRAVGGQIGSQQRHPGADNIGRTNSSGGFQPARSGKVAEVSRAIWSSLKSAQDTPTGQAENGMNPGQSNMTGNTLSDAEAHDSIAQIENRRRPAGYAENPPDDGSVGGAVGEQSWHPNASDVGRSNDSVGSGQQVVDPKEKSAAAQDPELQNLPDALKVNAFRRKNNAKTKEQKTALFQSAAADLSAHRLFDKIDRESKVAFCKETMYLDAHSRMQFFNELDRRLSNAR